MTHARLAGVAAAVLTLSLLAACHDSTQPGSAPLAALPADAYRATWHITSQDGGTVQATLRLHSGAAAPALGAYRVQLVLPPGVDTAALALDQSTAQGAAQRLLAVDGRTLRVVGVAPDGLSIGDLFTVRLRAPATLSTQALSTALLVQEWVDVQGVNRLARLELAAGGMR
jgi:hypothetical protein